MTLSKVANATVSFANSTYNYLQTAGAFDAALKIQKVVFFGSAMLFALALFPVTIGYISKQVRGKDNPDVNSSDDDLQSIASRTIRKK